MACPGAAGLANVLCDADIVEFTDDEITYQPGSFIREPLSNGRYTERKTSPAMSLTVHVPEDQTIKSFAEKCNTVWTFEWKSGRVVVLSQAHVTYEEEAVDVQTNKMRIKVIAKFCREMLNQGVNPGTSAQAA